MTYTLPHLSVISGKCHWPGCEAMATEIATDGTDYSPTTAGLYCNDHAHEIVEEKSPEYHTYCPTAAATLE